MHHVQDATRTFLLIYWEKIFVLENGGSELQLNFQPLLLSHEIDSWNAKWNIFLLHYCRGQLKIHF